MIDTDNCLSNIKKHLDYLSSNFPYLIKIYNDYQCSIRKETQKKVTILRNLSYHNINICNNKEINYILLNSKSYKLTGLKAYCINNVIPVLENHIETNVCDIVSEEFLKYSYESMYLSEFKSNLDIKNKKLIIKASVRPSIKHGLSYHREIREYEFD